MSSDPPNPRRDSLGRLRELMAGRFQQGVLWNVGGVGVLAVTGFVLQFSIGNVYDTAALGVFNQVMATYTIASQIAAGGLNLSALKEVAARPHDRRHVTTMIVTALVPTVALALLTTAAYWFSRGMVAELLKSPDVARGIEVSAVGLFFFALNKVLLSVVNGLQLMRTFALFTALRYLLILLALFVAIRGDRPGNELAYVFTFSEVALFVGLATLVASRSALALEPDWARWIRIHLVFGLKSLLSGVMMELNAKIDVWMIGVYMSDRDVGIYSFAALVAEGVNQLVIVLQNNYNPVLARTIAARDWSGLRALVRRGRRWTYLGMGVACGLAVLVFPGVMRLLSDRPEALEAHLPFAVLMAGVVVASGWLPFGQTLLMAGRPGWHSALMAATVTTNVALNWLLIPQTRVGLGLLGAALATAIALAASVIFLRVIVQGRLGVRI